MSILLFLEIVIGVAIVLWIATWIFNKLGVDVMIRNIVYVVIIVATVLFILSHTALFDFLSQIKI